jgi:hypothetical protein
LGNEVSPGHKFFRRVTREWHRHELFSKPEYSD